MATQTITVSLSAEEWRSAIAALLGINPKDVLKIEGMIDYSSKEIEISRPLNLE